MIGRALFMKALRSKGKISKLHKSLGSNAEIIVYPNKYKCVT